MIIKIELTWTMRIIVLGPSDVHRTFLEEAERNGLEGTLLALQAIAYGPFISTGLL